MMSVVPIILATLAGIGSLVCTLFWPTPAVQAFALLVWGTLFMAAVAWFFGPSRTPRRKQEA
ncbi:MAG: hypothetical protein D6678_07625 [Zetaproteobacteria bacterium]|nr:MAG: hypothetical protein D6678_07625 [Zetaproteobacteria bacterium]